MALWKGDIYDNRDDAEPSRSITITADTEEEAAEQARSRMGDAQRVDVTRIDPSCGPDLSRVNTAATDRFLRNLPSRTERE